MVHSKKALFVLKRITIFEHFAEIAGKRGTKHAKRAIHYYTISEGFTYVAVVMTQFSFKGDTCHINLVTAVMEWDFLYGFTILLRSY